MPAIPTACNVDHTGFVVPDLGEVIRFFTEVLGGELAYETEWMGLAQGETRIAMLRLGPVTNVELIENRPPHGTAPGRGDIGSPHIAFFVDDIDAAVAHLKRSNVAVAEPVQRPCADPIKGEAFVYSTAPWGTWMDIRTFAGPLPYEAQTRVRTYGPSERWDNGSAARS